MPWKANGPIDERAHDENMFGRDGCLQPSAASDYSDT
jgi:hypothetical protein